MARKYTKSYRAKGRSGKTRFALGESVQGSPSLRDDGLCRICGVKREEVMTVPYCYSCNRIIRISRQRDEAIKAAESFEKSAAHCKKQGMNDQAENFKREAERSRKEAADWQTAIDNLSDPKQSRRRDILYALENEPVTQEQAGELIEELAEIEAAAWDQSPMPDMPDIDMHTIPEVRF